jgi:2-amino-4-hydroxy-6-hydroxymethyldihydropteridine diphosphokinase
VTRVYLLLGSNVAPETNLPAAVDLLREHGLVAVSAAYATVPVGTDHPAPFLNAAAVIETGLAPEAVKREVCGAVERALGRVRDPRDKFAPRTIDVDIGLWGDAAAGVAPDPDILEHAHAARPLADVAGDLPHPVDGRPISVIADWLERRLEPAARPRPRPDLQLGVGD